VSQLLTITFVATSLAAAASDATIVVDYPRPYVLYQRDAANTGEVRIRGQLLGVTEPCRVEARFNGSPWQTLDAATEEGRFAGTIVGHTGQGKVEVRSASHPDAVALVEPVAVGDLFLVTGQSNADGRGSVNVTLAALYSHSPQRPPQLIAVKRTSDTELQLTYDRVLSVSDWRGRPSARPAGFRVVVVDISLADKDINSASVHGKTVLLCFNLPVPAAARLFYGSGVDAQNKPVLRDSKTAQPVPLLFGIPIP